MARAWFWQTFTSRRKPLFRYSREANMLQLALIFLVVGLLAGVLGFTDIAGASFAIAKFLAGLFLVLFLVFLILAIAGVRKVRKIVD
jgi:uncharacterized membrane protein YtjA (UPF0391 family)